MQCLLQFLGKAALQTAKNKFAKDYKENAKQGCRKQSADLRNFFVIQDGADAFYNWRHRIKVKKLYVPLRHPFCRIHHRRQKLPGHNDYAQDVLQVAYVHRKGASEQSYSQRQDVFNQQKNGQVQQGLKAYTNARDKQGRKDHHKAVKHVDKGSCYKRNGQNLARKVNLFYHVARGQNAAAAAGQRGAKKNPRNQRHKKKNVVFFDI